jgi:hypothetical protein
MDLGNTMQGDSSCHIQTEHQGAHASNPGGDLHKYRSECNILGIEEDALAAGDAAVARCLELAGKAHNTIPSLLQEFEAISNSDVPSYMAPGKVMIQQMPRNAEVYFASAGHGGVKEENMGMMQHGKHDQWDGSHSTHRASVTRTHSAEAPSSPGPTGLRHFTMRLCEKIQQKTVMTHNEIADELIADLREEHKAGQFDTPVEEKNVRRRVYDALNVLDAIGVVYKDKKHVEWVGWPGAKCSSESLLERLQKEKEELLRSVDQKFKSTYRTSIKCFCLSNLVLRNSDAPLPVLLAAHKNGVMAPNPLPLPFLMVQAPSDARTDIIISQNQRNASLNFYDTLFQVFDDEGVMRMMGLGEPCPSLLHIAAKASAECFSSKDLNLYTYDGLAAAHMNENFK